MTEADLLTGTLDIARVASWRIIHVRPGRTAHGWRTTVSGADTILARRGLRVPWTPLRHCLWSGCHRRQDGPYCADHIVPRSQGGSAAGRPRTAGV